MATDTKIYNNIFNSGLPLDRENKVLKATVSYLRDELSKLKSRALLVCEVKKIMKSKAVIKLANGNHFFVDILDGVAKKLKLNDKVLVEQTSLTIVDRLEKGNKYDVEDFLIIEKPNVCWEEIGGLKEQIKDIKEVIELPLKNPELFKKVGIQAPKGILLYGPSGVGKTLLARAIAASTNATFIEVVASELNQKYIGEGARLVKDLFALAKEKKPSIIFIDEIDAIASERTDIGGGEREVQRTFMQLLAELDGFESLDGVKIIAATNRLDLLDEALLRPGRLERLIEVPLPDKKGRLEILKVYMRNMGLDNLNLNLLLDKLNNFSGAEIKAVCTEAGYFAIRKGRDKVILDDFFRAINKFSESEEKIDMFG